MMELPLLRERLMSAARQQDKHMLYKILNRHDCQHVTIQCRYTEFIKPPVSIVHELRDSLQK